MSRGGRYNQRLLIRYHLTQERRLSFLKTVKLGRTGIAVSELCLGTLTMSCLQADMSRDQATAIFQTALQLGITFVDTAVSYQTHEHVRVGLGSRINDVVIATKVGAKELSQAREHIDQAFKELGREMIDIFLLHLIRDEEDFQKRRPVLDVLQSLKSTGRIRAVGISAHRISGSQVAVDHSDELDILFPIINRKGVGILDGTIDDQLAVTAQAMARGLGVYAMKPLGGGLLRKQAVGAINYVRSLPCVQAVAIGVKSPEELELNVAIFSDGQCPIDQTLLDRIAQMDRRLLVNFMCTRCGTCVEHCDQGALSLGEKTAEVDRDKCILCGYCAEHCPQFAMRVV